MPAEPKFSAPDPRDVDPRTVRRAFGRAAATYDDAAVLEREVATRMAQRLPKAVVENARASVVLGRTSSIDDIAEQVVTFCRADSVTGQVLVVDGGMHFH